jgi:hypothetical protein
VGSDRSWDHSVANGPEAGIAGIAGIGHGWGSNRGGGRSLAEVDDLVVEEEERMALVVAAHGSVPDADLEGRRRGVLSLAGRNAELEEEGWEASGRRRIERERERLGKGRRRRESGRLWGGGRGDSGHR